MFFKSSSHTIGAAARWAGATSVAISATNTTPTELDLLKILCFEFKSVSSHVLSCLWQVIESDRHRQLGVRPMPYDAKGNHIL